MYLYQNIPCSVVCLPSKQAKQKRENLSDKMKLCHSKPFILGTPKAGTTKPSIRFSTCLHNTLWDPKATLNTGYRALRWRNLPEDLGEQLEVIVSLAELSQRAYIYRKKSPSAALIAFFFFFFFGTGSLTDFGDPEWLDWVATEFQGPTYLVLPSTGIPGTSWPAGFCLFACLRACLFVLYVCPIQAQVLRSL